MNDTHKTHILNRLKAIEAKYSTEEGATKEEQEEARKLLDEIYQMESSADPPLKKFSWENRRPQPKRRR